MFKLQRIPLQIEILLSELEEFFNDHQWLHFKSILLSLLLTPYKATVSGMFKILSFGTHRSKHNEFLIKSNELIDKVLRYYAMLLISKLKRAKEPLYFIIDDTSNKKRGKHIEAAFSFLDHTTRQYIWGQQIICCILEYCGFVIPYSIEVYVPEDQCKEMGKEFQKKTTISLEILKTFECDERQEVVVLADCYYASATMINYCRANNYSFVSVLKSNRVFRINKNNTNVKKYIRVNFNNKKRQSVIRIKQTNYRTRTEKISLKTGGVVKVVFSKHQSHRTALAVFTTNTTLPAKKILEYYQRRWLIEVFFKVSKQNIGLKAYQNRNLNAIRSYLTLSLCAHNLLTHVFINDIREKGERLTDKRIAHFSISLMIDRIKFIAGQDTIDYCIENTNNPGNKSFGNELKKLLLAA